MGDAADHQIERDIDRALYPRGFDHYMTQQTLKRNREVIGGSWWKMKNGTSLRFDDMDLRHLGNVVALCERRGHPRIRELRDYYQNRVANEEGE